MNSFPMPTRFLFLSLLLPALCAISCTVSNPEPVPPRARFTEGCITFADSLVKFTNTSENATSFRWDLGNGQTSTDRSPSTTYANSGRYTVTLIVEGAESMKDTVARTITIHPPIPAARTLDIPFIAQGSQNWAWGAISEMILRHHGKEIPQCEILNEYFRTNCCNRPADCVVPGSLRQIEIDLERLAELESVHQISPMTMAQIRLEIAQNRPIVVGYERVGTVHSVMIYGYDELGNVMIHDPAVGSYTSTYNEALRYGSGSNYLEWTESTYCIR